jgi:hypothetical protein
VLALKNRAEAPLQDVVLACAALSVTSNIYSRNINTYMNCHSAPHHSHAPHYFENISVETPENIY